MVNSIIFLSMISIIERVRQMIGKDSDLIWTHYEHVEDLLAEININNKLLYEQDKQGADYFNVAFLPTSTYQELAMSNGWSEEYMHLAARFDKLYEQLVCSEHS